MSLRRNQSESRVPEIGTSGLMSGDGKRGGGNVASAPASILDSTSNGYGAHSPGGYALTSCLVAEVVFTFMFLMIFLGATDRRAPAGFAGIPIGLGLTLIHLIGIPVTNLSVNPARSTGPAVFVGGWAIEQLWLFWVAPIAGAVIAGVVYPMIASETEPEPATGRAATAGGRV